MKYMLLIYQNPENWESLTASEVQRVMSDVDVLMSELMASGEWVGGAGLAHPSAAKTVRVRDGETLVTDGPFVEAKEHLAGYTIVDCETPERAYEIAARWPDARYWGIEVRALMTAGGDDA